MAGYKVCAVVEARNATIMIDPDGRFGEKTNGDTGVMLAFKMHNDPQVNRLIVLNDQDVDNLFAAIREVQRLRDGETARGSHTEAQESPKSPNQ